MAEDSKPLPSWLGASLHADGNKDEQPVDAEHAEDEAQASAKPLYLLDSGQRSCRETQPGEHME